MDEKYIMEKSEIEDAMDNLSSRLDEIDLNTAIAITELGYPMKAQKFYTQSGDIMNYHDEHEITDKSLTLYPVITNTQVKNWLAVRYGYSYEIKDTRFLTSTGICTKTCVTLYKTTNNATETIETRYMDDLYTDIVRFMNNRIFELITGKKYMMYLHEVCDDKHHRTVQKEETEEQSNSNVYVYCTSDTTQEAVELLKKHGGIESDIDYKKIVISGDALLYISPKNRKIEPVVNFESEVYHFITKFYTELELQSQSNVRYVIVNDVQDVLHNIQSIACNQLFKTSKHAEKKIKEDNMSNVFIKKIKFID